MIEMIGLIGSLILLMWMTLKGINIIVAALISSLIVAITGGLNLETALTDYYITGFTGYFASWFFIFLLGAIFGKIMQETQAADSIANWVSRTFGPQRAVFATVAAAAIMTYGGVSLFVVGFAVYPIAVSLFKRANLPHRFIPGALAFGSVSFTMTSPGSPEIQNLIPTEFFGTTPTAGGIVGVIVGLTIMLVGGFTISRMVKKAVTNGEGFYLPDSHPLKNTEAGKELEADEEKTAEDRAKELPNIIFAILPLVVVIAGLNILAQFMSSTAAAMISLTAGVALACILM